MIHITEEEQELLINLKKYAPETYYHCLRVKKYVYKTLAKAKEKGAVVFTPEEIDVICKGAMLHDIGKINTNNKILTLPEGLNDEQMDIMKKHTVIGAGTIDEYLPGDEKPIIKEICEYHHERTDGGGYFGAVEITPYVQLVAICDVYDALTSDRVYRDKFEPDVAIDMIENNKCGKFDDWAVESLKETVLTEEQKYEANGTV